MEFYHFKVEFFDDSYFGLFEALKVAFQLDLTTWKHYNFNHLEYSSLANVNSLVIFHIPA